jgi:hypothetical protein
MVRTGGMTGQAQLAVAAISRLDVDVAPFVGTTRERFAAALGPRPCLVIEDAPAGIATGDATASRRR